MCRQYCKYLCCCCSVTQLFLTLCNPRTRARQASLSFTISWNLLRLMATESMMPPNHLTQGSIDSNNMLTACTTWQQRVLDMWLVLNYLKIPSYSIELHLSLSFWKKEFSVLLEKLSPRIGIGIFLMLGGGEIIISTNRKIQTLGEFHSFRRS